MNESFELLFVTSFSLLHTLTESSTIPMEKIYLNYLNKNIPLAPRSDKKWHKIFQERHLFDSTIVQAFYRKKSVNLPLIAKEGFLTVFGPGTCPL